MRFSDIHGYYKASIMPHYAMSMRKLSDESPRSRDARHQISPLPRGEGDGLAIYAARRKANGPDDRAGREKVRKRVCGWNAEVIVLPRQEKLRRGQSDYNLGELPMSLVPKAGLEPAQSGLRGILSPLRLPVPPLRHA